MPYFGLKDRLCHRITVIVDLVIASEIMHRDGDKRLDVEIELVDRVTTVLCLQFVIIRTGSDDGLSSPFDSRSRTTPTGVDEPIGRMHDHLIGDERVAAFTGLEQVRWGEGDIRFEDTFGRTRRLEL